MFSQIGISVYLQCFSLSQKAFLSVFQLLYLGPQFRYKFLVTVAGPVTCCLFTCGQKILILLINIYICREAGFKVASQCALIRNIFWIYEKIQNSFEFEIKWFTYLLETCLSPFIDEIPLQEKCELWFQQDGASAHEVRISKYTPRIFIDALPHATMILLTYLLQN